MRSRIRPAKVILVAFALNSVVANAQFVYSCLGSGPAAVGGVGLTGTSSSSSSSSTLLPRQQQYQRGAIAATTPHNFYYVNSSSTSSTSSSEVRTAGMVRPASVCPADPPFKQTADSRSVCRLVINAMDGQIYYCTAWFIGYNHVATAGHCVMGWGPEGPFYSPNPDAPGGPGYVCCKFSRNGRCLEKFQWKLVSWVTTQGFFLNQPSRSNDGAVIKVLPMKPNNFVIMIPQAIMPFTTEVPAGVVYLDGYPMQTFLDEGCGTVDETKRYFTQSNVTAIALGPADGVPQAQQGMAIKYRLSGCAGQSGGRVLWGGASGYAFGLQTFGWEDCKQGKGMTGVTLITQQQQDCGVCLTCLMKAIP